MKCHEVLNTSINAVQSGTKVQTFLRNLMSAYLGLSSSETLRFYKTTRGQIPIKLSPYRPGQSLKVANGGGSQNKDNQHTKVAMLSALRTGRCNPTRYPWYSFLLEAESTPGS
jgi:hypothetical protein